MFRSLNSRLLLSYLAIILVCLALVGLGLLVFARPLWASATVLRLEAALRATLPLVLQAGSPRQVDDLLAQAAAEQEVRVLLLDGDGVVRFDSDGAWDGKQLTMPARPRVMRDRLRGVFTRLSSQ